ncbi:MAG: cyclic pyranopterin monophosphate synthase MoaC [Syntrophomonadaceae bacterium]|jgi:cyclic pyranopterin phosphate synthase|nr:cyclic pyranopterin monophosphate synthase MoaC [Syntrophomonadaceae bacterium]
MDFTHINEQGQARMVDVSGKEDTERAATAQAIIQMQPATLELIKTGGVKKGNVLSAAQVAGIMAAKKTSELVPMCHPLMITSADINFMFDDDNSRINITATVKTTGKTGVEMEAITAASVAAITIYDMTKAVDRWMVIREIMLLEKEGGKSGHIERSGCE